MTFYEYKNGEITPLLYPMTSDIPNPDSCFLVYAQDVDDAKNASERHLAGEPLKTLKNFRLNHDTVYPEIRDVAVGTFPEEEL